VFERVDGAALVCDLFQSIVEFLAASLLEGSMSILQSRHHRLPVIFGAAVLQLFFCSLASAQQIAQCPNPPPNPPPTVLSFSVPADVCIPAGFPGNPIDFFDDYSWRAFIALIWPAKQGERGQPDQTAQLGAPNRPLVFETYKAEWEVFQPNGNVPADWNDYQRPAAIGLPATENPCALANIKFGDLLLSAFSKFENLGQAGFGNLAGPLVAQNKTYVRYLTAFNEIEFKQILSEKLYLRENLANKTFQNSAIDIKAAWIDMSQVEKPERYHTRKAFLLNLVANTCEEKTVGLVGLHIVQKTPSRPQWTWSTFEHIDNVPPPDGANKMTFNANDGVKMPDPSNPIVFPPPTVPPTVFNVDRLKPVHPQTQATNQRYRAALAAAGPWQFYQLTMTQWPLSVADPSKNGKPPNTFPGVAASTNFANTTMETFDQKSIATGCMNCHNGTRENSDFVWSLVTRAFPPVGAVIASQPPSPASLAVKSLSPNLFTAKAPPPSTVFTMPQAQLNSLIELKGLLETSRRSP
jgi:hypothetical protein